MTRRNFLAGALALAGGLIQMEKDKEQEVKDGQTIAGVRPKDDDYTPPSGEAPETTGVIIHGNEGDEGEGSGEEEEGEG